jgi:hypothetical protein
MLPLLAGWKEYEKLLPPDASREQIIETRRAFYAGALVLFSELQRVGDSDASEEEGAKFLETIQIEFDTFEKMLRERKV